MNQEHILLTLRKPILKYTLNKIQVHWISSFKHFKLPISIKIPLANCLYLQDSYIIKLDFINYAFAKLVLAWLYYCGGHSPDQYNRTGERVTPRLVAVQLPPIWCKVPLCFTVLLWQKLIPTLVNVYVDLLVFTHIAGTS